MKQQKIIVACCLMALSALALQLQSCGGGKGDPTPKQTDAQKNQQILISSGWTVQSVMVDGVDKTSIYTGLTLSFSATAFTTTHGGSVWPASGTWKFSDDTGKTITRDDGLTIGVDEIQSNGLTLSLTWTKTTLGPGRVESTAGKHVFKFVR